MVHAEVTGVRELTRSLQAHTFGYRKVMDVEVGYDAPYALRVHEDLQVFHPSGGQAKFLEVVYRTRALEVKRIVLQSLRNKEGLAEALRKAGDYVLAESRKLVPVRTGFLRDSGYVRVK